MTKKILETITERYFEANEITTEILRKFTICNNKSLNNFSIKYIHVFDDENGFNALFVSMYNNVYGFGSNQWVFVVWVTTRMLKIPKLYPNCVIKMFKNFTMDWFFVLCLTSDNELYGWGRNDWFQLGSETLNEENNKPLKIDIEERSFKQISCGSKHTLVLTSDGFVYGWDNKYGQIGCGKELGEKILITRLISLPIIKAIHCSLSQSFALTDNGMVYSWGDNEWCHLGHDLDQNECIFEPKFINLFILL